MSAFEAIAESGALEPVDLHFARLLRRLAGAGDDTIALTAALLSRQRSRGHSCIDPGAWAGRPFPADAGAALPRLPERAAWERALAESPLVGDGDSATPIVRDGAGRLYLLRYWRAERRLARRLRQGLEAPPPALDAAALAPLFRALFDPPEPAAAGADDRQALAAASALAGWVTLISGGPGTGKTTTVGRLIALLLAADPELEVALAAPTGKAAARLGEAALEQAGRLPIPDELRARMPGSAATLHRLLGYQPRRDRFRHHAGRPLTTGALVIDEVSMVDLLLMDAALDALPAGARVVLLGDKDQLTSVETGSVFGDLCAAAGIDSLTAEEPERATRVREIYRTLSGRRPSTDGVFQAAPASPLGGAAVELVTSYRFRDQPGIGELADALRRGDAAGALAVLDDPSLVEASRLDPPDEHDSLLAPLQGPLEAYLAAADPAEALELLGGFRLLCARRQGRWGVARLNAAVESRLARRGHPVVEGHYPGRPIMITANDYQVRLFNGDLGVCWNAAPDHLQAFFPGPGGEPRRLPLARLPPHETAWAMTVHKAQGSEFDRVLLVLGDAESRVASRELLYTGVTRARRSVVVAATPEVIRGAVARRSRRVSGLADALRGTVPEAPEPEPEPPVEAEPEAPDEDDGSGQLSLFG